MKTFLRVRDLTKKFGDVLAVKNISFEVFKGMRAVVTTGGLPLDEIVLATVLNLIWAIVSIIIFYKMFDYVRQTGHLLGLID